MKNRFLQKKSSKFNGFKKNHQNKKLCGEFKMQAKKSLGQNFLTNNDIAEKICNSVEITGKNIIEIGPGQGFLTKHIISNEPKKLVLVEKDTRMIEILSNLLTKNSKTKLSILNEDALKFGISSLGEKNTIIANLPYNIGTTLVVNWLEYLDFIDNIVVMLQKEVVDRICAKPKTKDYGRISVLIQSMCDVEFLFNVGKENFEPQPKVMSAVVKITPKQEHPDKKTFEKLDALCHVTFSQRRKKLVNVLKNHIKTKNIILPDFITENARAEELSVENFIEIVMLNYNNF